MTRCVPTISALVAVALLVGCRASPSPAGETRSEDPAARTAQAPVDWLATEAVRIRSLSPSDTDFADLEPLGQAIDGARVVFLTSVSETWVTAHPPPRGKNRDTANLAITRASWPYTGQPSEPPDHPRPVPQTILCNPRL